MYNVLLELPVRKNNIKEGNMGELLVKLWMNKKETEENHATLHQIIEKWLRLVTGMSDSFPRGGERGLGGHCRVEEGVPVCGESPPHQGMLDLGRTMTISHSGAGGEIDLCDDAKVRALWEYDRQGRAESLRE